MNSSSSIAASEQLQRLTQSLSYLQPAITAFQHQGGILTEKELKDLTELTARVNECRRTLLDSVGRKKSS